MFRGIHWRWLMLINGVSEENHVWSCWLVHIGFCAGFFMHFDPHHDWGKQSTRWLRISGIYIPRLWMWSKLIKIFPLRLDFKYVWICATVPRQRYTRTCMSMCGCRLCAGFCGTVGIRTYLACRSLRSIWLFRTWILRKQRLARVVSETESELSEIP